MYKIYSTIEVLYNMIAGSVQYILLHITLYIYYIYIREHRRRQSRIYDVYT